eukprot:jgi/Botrbrau1/19147/Bobra.0077s0059.1
MSHTHLDDGELFLLQFGSDPGTAALQLQTNGVLNECKASYGGASFQKVLQRLQELLMGLPDGPVSMDAGLGFASALGVAPKPWVFHPPSSVAVAGSAALKTAAKPNLVADVAVEMPAACFHDKDFLDGRYLYRRAVYLDILAKALRESPKKTFRKGKLRWSCLHGDARKPVLLVTPHHKKKGQTGEDPTASWVLRLIPTIPVGTFPLPRLGPSRGNVWAPQQRSDGLRGEAPRQRPVPQGAGPTDKQPAGSSNPAQEPLKDPPARMSVIGRDDPAVGVPPQGEACGRRSTSGAAQGIDPPGESARTMRWASPFYNSCILEDMLLKDLHEAVQKGLGRVPALRDTIVLLKVWSRQQSLGDPDAFGGFLLSALAVHLANIGTLAPAMTSLQAFRAVLQALALPKTFSRGLRMAAEGPAEPGPPAGAATVPRADPPDMKQFRQAFPVVFLDPSGFLNLAARLSKGSLLQAQGAAQRTVALLDSRTTPDHVIDAVFLNGQPLVATFDYFWRVVVESPSPAAPLSGDRIPSRSLEARIEALVTRGLGDRAKVVRVFPRAPAEPQNMDDFEPRLQEEGLLVAAQVQVEGDPSPVSRRVDKGPAETDPAGADFLQFWGKDKADLRSFQDGSVRYAVVWDVPPSQVHTICDCIVDCVLKRHLTEKGTALGVTVVPCSTILDGALLQLHVTMDEQLAATRRLAEAEQNLGKRLRMLEGLPLKAVAVTAMCPAARRTAAFPPLPHPLAGGPAVSGDRPVPRCLEPIELAVKLEGSGKWPDDASHFQKVKSGFCVHLAQLLRDKFGIRADASEPFVDVFFEGFVFRIHLHSERDQALATRTEAMERAVPGVTAGAAQDHAKSFRRLQRAVQHHALVVNAASRPDAPALVPTARLASRWVSAHLLSNHLSTEAVELLVASLFCSPSTVGPPGSRLVGFLRFLRLLSRHRWEDRPLVVEAGSGLQSPDEAASQGPAVPQETGAHPSGHMALCTPGDPRGLDWTGDRPSRPVLARLSKLAERCAQLLEAHITSGVPAEGPLLEALFTPVLADFDAVIRLRKDALPNWDRGLLLAQRKKRKAWDADLGYPRVPSGPPAALSRALLRHIPQDALEKMGRHKAARELLVGFDPVASYTRLLESRLEPFAIVGADFVGGSEIALKWRPKAWVPQSLTPEVAHVLIPVSDATSDATGGHGGKSSKSAKKRKRELDDPSLVTLGVPDAELIMEDVQVLGEGLVESYVLLRCPDV